MVPPYRPETLEKLKRRYQLAIDPPIDVESVILGSMLPATEQRRCIFDFEDGVRLIVAKAVYADGSRFIHVGALFFQDSKIFLQLTRLLRKTNSAKDMFDAFVRDSEKRFAELSGDKRRLRLAANPTDNVLPHWLIKEDG